MVDGDVTRNASRGRDMSEGPVSTNWIKREVSMGNVLLIVTMSAGFLSAVGAGIWQGSRINTTLSDGVAHETEMRVEQNRALNDKLTAFGVALNDVKQDVQSLRHDVLIMVVKDGKHD